MINKDRNFFQYNRGDLVYIISPLTTQLCTMSRKVTIKFVGPVVIYKIIDPHTYLLMTLDGKISRGLLKHERLKPANIRTSQGKVCNLAQLKQIINVGLKCDLCFLETPNALTYIQNYLYAYNINFMQIFFRYKICI